MILYPNMSLLLPGVRLNRMKRDKSDVLRQNHFTETKSPYQPSMEDSDLPTSPRKKLKLEEPSIGVKMADTVSKVVPEITAGIPHNDRASTTAQFSGRPTTGSVEASILSDTSTPPTNITNVQTLKSAVVTSESNVDNPPNPSQASGDSRGEQTSNALETQSGITNADAIDVSYNKEAACGITEFVSPDLLGFSGILKKRYVFFIATANIPSDICRYTDFLVNEILPSGEVVHLDNLKAPSKRPKKTGSPTDAGKASSADATEHTTEKPPATKEPQQPGSARTTASEGETQNFHQTETSKPHHSTAPVNGQQKVSPHKRIPPPAPSIPLSMQDLDGKQLEPKQEKVTRRKEKVYIRQTSQGWVEFDKEEEDKVKKRKAQDDAAAGVQPEDVTQAEAIKPEETGVLAESTRPTPEQVPKASTQASWQAYAGSASSSNFQVSTSVTQKGVSPTFMQLQPEDKATLLSSFSSRTLDEVLALFDRVVDSPHRKTRDYGIVTSEVIDRQKRTSLHQDIRRIFNSRLETTTDKNGAMMITAMVKNPTFHARTPMDTKARNNERGDHRGKDKGSDPVNGRGKDDHPGRQAFSGTKGKPDWEDLGGKSLHFSLYKENKDTMEAISWLSKQVRMHPRSFHFAGTKDRRAVTVQRVSVDRVLVNAMISAGRTLRNAHIGNFEYRPHPLQLGELTGNEFVITLRDCEFDYPVPLESNLILEGAQAVVSEAINNLSEKGFINYYGLQRFGTFAIGTEIVGLKMLRGDFRGAVDAILDYSPASLEAAQNPVSGNTNKISMDDKARAHALHSYRTKSRSDQVLRELPRRFSAESSIIRHLTGRSEHREDYLGALQTISRNLRLMYVHAYQSLVWNVAASERWKRFGLSVIEGDLVLVNDHIDDIENVTKAENVDADGEAIVLPATDDRATNPDDIFERARALTKGEAECGKYNIFDVVLPTPGYDILYPSNEIGKFYEEFMASERGGGLDAHDMRRQWKDISLSGSYRKFLARPGKDFSFEIKTYKDEDEQFVMTDMDRLRLGSKAQRNKYPRHGSDIHAHHDTAAGSSADPEQESEPVEKNGNSTMNEDIDDTLNGNGTENITGMKSPSSRSEDVEQGGVSLNGGAYRDYKIAVILKLQLASSQYATMALRELMKSGGVKTYKADFSGGR